MKTIMYKKNLIAIISLSIIFFSLSILLSAMSYFNLFHPFFYSFLQSASTLPLIFLGAIVEGMYNSIPDEHRTLKILIVILFLAFALFAIHINQEIFNYATL